MNEIFTVKARQPMGKHQRYIVQLDEAQRNLLNTLIKTGEWKPRVVQRAMVLLLADIDGKHALQDNDICDKLGCSMFFVGSMRTRFAKTQSIEDTIFDRPRSGRPTIVDGAVEAHVTKIACSSPPTGYARWSLNLIRDRVVSLNIIDTISPSTVGRCLKKKSLSRG